MSLLQLVEPGEPQPTDGLKAVVGIDLGTTNTLVATVRDAKPEVLLDAQGRGAIPSVVCYRDSAPVAVGYDATEMPADDSSSVIASVKRIMGRGREEVASFADLFGCRLADDESGVPRLQTRAGKKTAAEVSAEILRVCKKRAEDALRAESIDGAVITVPAYFDDVQRQATRDAARLAGIHVYRLINEPTAAAVAYGLERGSEGETIAVFDLGGGTFDVSVLKLEKGVLRVIATGGDTLLGGDDFDRAVADYWTDNAAHDRRLGDTEQRRLLGIARRAKEAICDGRETYAACLAVTGGDDWELKISCAEFNRLIAPLVDKVAKVGADVFADLDLKPSDIDDVVLVGGSTRIPAIRQRVSEIFERQPLEGVDPYQVVAIGAAIQADTLSGNRSICDDLLLLDVASLSLGVETMGGLTEKIIPRNSVIPFAKSQEFTTACDGQTAISFHVVQGERDLAADCRSLAHFELKDIPPRVAGAARVKVTFRIDADGLLTVEAQETETNAAASVEVKPTYGLSEKEVTAMIQDSVAHAADDMDARARAEKLVDAKRLLDSIESALAEDGDALLSAEEYDTICAARDALREQVDTGDSDAIGRAMTELESRSEFYVERRMNRSIRRALRGQSAEEIGRG